MVVGPSTHLRKLFVKRIFKLFQLAAQFAINVLYFSIKVKSEDEVDVVFKLQIDLGMRSLYS